MDKFSQIQVFVSQLGIKICDKINGEGRIASLLDEELIVSEILQDPILSKFCKKPPPRDCGDLLVFEYDMWQPVNIKTTKGDTVDNATSKKGFVYAFTDRALEDIPNSLSYKKMFELIKKYEANNPYKDYRYLVVNKLDSADVLLKGCKQISEWKSNPSNDLQINWLREKGSETQFSYEESLEKVKEAFRQVKIKQQKRWPEEF